MTKVYVIQYYPYIYGEEAAAEAEFKDILTHDNPEIIGIYSTLAKAKRAFTKQIQALARECDIKYANEQSEMNYEIREFDLDGTSDYHTCKYILRVANSGEAIIST